MEVADHAAAFSRYFVHDVQITQVQLDELFALLSAVKAGEVSEPQALKCLSRSPHWVWGAIDPVSKLLLTIDVGDRTLAMAQRIIHQVVQGLAPDCGPLFLTDGFKEYMTALLAHYGHWVQPPRRRTPRASSHASLDAAAGAVLCAGHQDLPAPPPGRHMPPRGVWDLGRSQSGAGRHRLADQHRVH